jgi:methyl-accepting chemotaxis protein
MKWYINLKIAAKLIIGFLVVAIIAAVVGIIGLINITRINEADTQLFEHNTLGVYYAGVSNASFERLRYNALKLTTVNTDEEEADCIAKIEELCSKVDGSSQQYVNTIEHEEDIAFFEEMRLDWEEYKGYMQEVIKYNNAGEDSKAKDVILIDSDEIGDELRTDFTSLMENNEADARQRSLMNDTLASKAIITMAVVIAFGVLISIVLGICISHIISNPILQIMKAADKLALGDVDVSIKSDSKDEIGSLVTSFGKMIENIRNQALSAEKIAAGDLTIQVPISSANDLLGNKLSEMVRKNNEVLSNIYVASEQVAVGSKQVSDSSILLAQGASEQSSTIEELTASIEEISSQTELNAHNANRANELAEDAKSNAKQGNSQMQEMLKAMDEINESSTNISKVIKVIDDIAFQTNILALNAAVEAARAGQHGKGFAVVAEEVRNLAARSASAAKETTEMIEGSIKKSEGGTKIARNTAQALDKIVDGIEQVAELVNDIASASSEQSLGIQQINQGIIQVSQVVQSNSATSEESAAASEELSSQAELLKETVNQFKINKNTNTYNKYEKLTPDVLAMLENLSATGSNNLRQISDRHEETSAPKPMISLNDTEYGKY